MLKRLSDLEERDAEKDKILNEIIRILKIADAIDEGKSAYNIACVYSILKNENQCRNWLFKSKALRTLTPKEHIMNDKDFDNMRDKEWFKEFIESLD